MRRRLTLSDEQIGITATWTGGAVAILVDDRTGRVIARGAVEQPATPAQATSVLERLIESERGRRRGAG